MAEEFQESEVVFQEIADYGGGAKPTALNFPVSCHESSSDKRKRSRLSKKRSVPVSIPVSAPWSRWFRCVDEEFDGGDEGEMVPPHVIIGRRVTRKMMALSICTGNGRILKGRDLSEFRNLVLRMTGFLET